MTKSGVPSPLSSHSLSAQDQIGSKTKTPTSTATGTGIIQRVGARKGPTIAHGKVHVYCLCITVCVFYRSSGYKESSGQTWTLADHGGTSSGPQVPPPSLVATFSRDCCEHRPAHCRAGDLRDLRDPGVLRPPAGGRGTRRAVGRGRGGRGRGGKKEQTAAPLVSAYFPNS